MSSYERAVDILSRRCPELEALHEDDFEDLFGEAPWGALKGLMGPATRRLAEKLERGES